MGAGAGENKVERERVHAIGSKTQPAFLPERLPEIPEDLHTPEQHSAWDEVVLSRGRIGGPFAVLLRSPKLLTRLQRVGAYLRFDSMLPAHLSELVILLVARAWTQNFEWAVHAPIAREAGLHSDIIEAISEGTRPTDAPEDVVLVVDFCTELMQQRGVSDAVYARSLALLGEQGVVEMTAIVGYYTTLAMVMNVARTHPPAGSSGQLRPLP
jgi:4-carboxymuconolactone decarboxylase